MATTKSYKDFIIEELSLLDNITCKPMYLVSDVDKKILKNIVLDTYSGLKNKE